MTAQLVAVIVDALEPRGLARFRARALRWDVGDGDEPTDATTLRVVFRPGAGAKVARNRIHLDLTTASSDDRDETVADLLALGAAHVDIRHPDWNYRIAASLRVAYELRTSSSHTLA